jgi:glycosyltransferase involved in cell wall biosynthesis
VNLPTGDVDFKRVESGIDAMVSNVTSSGASVLHLHGLWSPILHRAARRARRHGVPYVVSARGMLTEWALGHRAWRKKIAWWLYQKRDLLDAACLLASSEFEKQGIEALLPGHRIEVIPNSCAAAPEAVDGPNPLPAADGTRWALALGRLHRVKGYAELIEAWSRVRPFGWKLAIAGPDEGGYRSVLEQRIARHNLQQEVLLSGAADETAKWSLLRQCELFLAPSHTENFGMAIAEALQAGRPVITTRGTPWRELQEVECGWWVELTPETLDQALREATASTGEKLHAMGERGRALIRDRYSWDSVAARTLEMYRSVLQGSPT